MFDKKEPKEVTLYIGQNTLIGGYIIFYLGKLYASTCVFCFRLNVYSCTQMYVPINGIFYRGPIKIKIIQTTDESVTLGWEG